MSRNRDTPQGDILRTTTNAPEPDKDNSTLMVRELIEDTPFMIVGNEEQGYFAGIGNYKITETQPTIEMLKELIKTRQWEVTVNLIIAIVELRNKANNKTEYTE